MPVVQAIVLGVVQGITEFLPISSTAHLRVVPALLGWGDPGVAYSAVIQLGSVIAVLSYFWRDLWDLALGSFRALKRKDLADRHLRLAGAMLLGTVPICVIGLLLKPYLEQPDGLFRSLLLIAGASIFMGVLLLIAERWGKHQRGIDSIGVQDGLLVGLGQALALIPGCSRSGSTLTVAMLLNLRRDDAARFSFLLGIPAIVLSGLLEFKECCHHWQAAQMTDLAVGLISAAVVSYLSIAWLLKYLGSHSTLVFVGYRLLFGLVVGYLTINHLIH